MFQQVSGVGTVLKLRKKVSTGDLVKEVGKLKFLNPIVGGTKNKTRVNAFRIEKNYIKRRVVTACLAFALGLLGVTLISFAPLSASLLILATLSLVLYLHLTPLIIGTTLNIEMDMLKKTVEIIICRSSIRGTRSKILLIDYEGETYNKYSEYLNTISKLFL